MKTLNSLSILAFTAVIANCAQSAVIPSEEDFKKAAIYVLSSECGNSAANPGFVESAKLLLDAGPELIPVLVQIVADKNVSDHVIQGVAGLACRHPFSQHLRAALRVRRDANSTEKTRGAPLDFLHISPHSAIAVTLLG